MEQQLLGIFHEPLFHVFIGVQKAYDFLDRGRYMEIIRGYGMGPKLQRILQRCWDGKKVIPKAGSLFGRHFNTEIEVTQGNTVSPTIFNILVDAVIRKFFLEVCGPQEDQHGLGWGMGDHNV